MTLKLKFCDFSQITRAHSFPGGIGERTAIQAQARRLTEPELPLPRSVRLLGVSLSDPVPKGAPSCGLL